MAKRLAELYRPGDKVEIFLTEVGWMAGIVTAYDPPGIWVQTSDGRRWFVTNRQRIRMRKPNA
ncbi:MAG: hypothetical protein ACE5E7_03605 [Anaerolineae bacterium]